MRTSKLLRLTSLVLLSSSLLTISCGDGGAKRTIDNAHEFSPDEKIIVRSSIFNTPASNTNDDNYNYQNRSFLDPNYSRFQNPRQVNNQVEQNHYVLAQNLEFVRVPADINVSQDNIDSLFNESESVSVTQRTLSSSNFATAEQENTDNSNLTLGNLLVESQDSLPLLDPTTLDIDNFSSTEIFNVEKTVRVEARYIGNPIFPGFTRPASLNRIAPQGVSVPGAVTQAQPQMVQQNMIPNYATSTQAGYQNTGMYPGYYNNDQVESNETSELAPISLQDLILSDDSTCENEDGCFWFTKLDTFTSQYVTDLNDIGSLWNYTAISYRTPACTSLDCTLAVTLESTFTTDSYSYAVYSVQN